MGRIAEGVVAYARPLLEQTDGSEEQVNRAFAISQLCFNLALTPEESRERAIGEMKPSLEMDDEEFEDFRRSIILPMIRRHEEMFPDMHKSHGPTGSSPTGPASGARSYPSGPKTGARAEAYPGTDRYAPCPCNSGRKYKFCCGKKRR